MEFYLNYRGPLRATQRDPKPGSRQRATHWKLKHEMRRSFHRQLKRQWEITEVLRQNQRDDIDHFGGVPKPFHAATLANEFQLSPWQFVPLVTGRLELICGIEILVQRLDSANESVWSGDIDNRVKTLIDALEIPEREDGYADLVPLDGENPLYCLLENDKYLNHVSIETSHLLDAPEGTDKSFADVKIKVSIRPGNLTYNNMGL